jgi:hypothetical protein
VYVIETLLTSLFQTIIPLVLAIKKRWSLDWSLFWCIFFLQGLYICFQLNTSIYLWIYIYIYIKKNVCLAVRYAFPHRLIESKGAVHKWSLHPGEDRSSLFLRKKTSPTHATDNLWHWPIRLQYFENRKHLLAKAVRALICCHQSIYIYSSIFLSKWEHLLPNEHQRSFLMSLGMRHKHSQSMWYAREWAKIYQGSGKGSSM